MPSRSKSIAVVATLDTKGAEAAFVCETLRHRGEHVLTVDIGTRGTPTFQADYTREHVLQLACNADDADPEQPAKALGRRSDGARTIIHQLFHEETLRGVIGIGGGKGSAACFQAMQDLPYGFPRVLVTSARPAMLAEFAAQADVILYPTLVDLFGLNSFTKPVLANAAHAVAAMHFEPAQQSRRKSIAVTAFGVTTPAANAIKSGLEQSDIEVIVFPANGAGGRAMEAMLANGAFDAVVDLTTTEMADLLVGGTASAGPSRLTAAGKRGVPQLIAPGAVDMVNFGAPDSIPPEFAERTFFRHTPHTTLMRTSTEECAKIGEATAERLNTATGPTTVFWPARGVSDYDRDGQSFHDPQADRAWRDAVFAAVNDAVETKELDCHINDPEFAEACVRWTLRATEPETST